ncbi:hypothetical protein GR138_12820 [Shinella kummerowiae]|uniref:Chromosomal replication initiator DnaA C-terminal domain-containing protein n=1 Tax=Shinella kummerowiae TaxID=417745 RepID=A0A6N8SBT8_9HYPH|nr:helix-turn-helix domain-containing protein [Shinella kummerowiae]MXN46073.1 hypothetical protein [Shinella kummerowiae]
MNWQPLSVQPFDPANYRQPIIERRRRLMGNPVRQVVRARPQAAEVPSLDVQHDEHVKAWQRWKLVLPVGRCSRHVYTRCIELGANYNDVIGPTRRRDIVPVRHLLMWELRHMLSPQPSYPEIGVVFKRHHTSIFYAVTELDQKRGEPHA